MAGKILNYDMNRFCRVGGKALRCLEAYFLT
nr:MAG TPA: hypothetical protein [Caudoviricetes sp.]